MPSAKPAAATRATPLSRDGTLLMTAEQHRRQAARLRALAGRPGSPPPDKVEMWAASHDQIAQALERRAKPH